MTETFLKIYKSVLRCKFANFQSMKLYDLTNWLKIHIKILKPCSWILSFSEFMKIFIKNLEILNAVKLLMTSWFYNQYALTWFRKLILVTGS